MRYRKLGNGCLGGCLGQYLSHWYRVPLPLYHTIFSVCCSSYSGFCSGLAHRRTTLASRDASAWRRSGSRL